MKKGILVLLIFTTIISEAVTAQTWNGSLNSDWNTAANWTPATVPAAGSAVTLNNAAAPNQPVLAGDVSITSLAMSAGILNLNSFTITCTGNATFTGDSLVNGKVVASNFVNMQNMRMGGKITLDKTGVGDNFWSGNNKVYTDSLIVLWREGTLVLENGSPDSVFANFKIQLISNAAVGFSWGSNLFIQNNLVIDNAGQGYIEFGSGANSNTVVVGNLVGLNFTGNLNSLYLRKVNSLGTDANGPFYCNTGDINNSRFNGDFTLIADSSQVFNISNSWFLGNNNLLQAGRYDVLSGNLFGQTGNGTTTLRIANKTANNRIMTEGNNKFFGNAVFEANATGTAGTAAIIQNTISGQDSCFGNVTYLLKNNSALLSNFAGNSYVAGNVIIDAQGVSRWIDFGSGNNVTTYTVAGNFTAQNFAPGLGPVILHRVRAQGTGSCGVFNAYNASILNSSFNGDFTLLADSSQVFNIQGSWFLGNNNLLQAGRYDVLSGNLFGQTGNGTTTLRMANKTNNLWLMPEGNNKFFGNAVFDVYAMSIPGSGAILQQSIAGMDSCFGNVTISQSGITATTLATGGNLFIGKGLTLNNNSPVNSIIHNNPSTAIRFIGTDTASYSFSGSGTPPSFVNIELNRQGGLRLQSPLTYSGTLGFTRGIILSSSTNTLSIPNGANAVGAWDSSYVDGPVIKTGNTAFTFPLGKNNVYAPISITAPALVTDAFRAQYFNTNAHDAGFDSTQRDITLHHISGKEYWLLDRTNGAATPKVTLSWKTNRSSIVNVMNDLRVARWNGTAWKDEGNGGIAGTNAEGTVQSLNDISNFSPFTLASNSFNNPLPVNFIFFGATVRNDHAVLLQWKTAQEINNDRFEVQRSSDGRSWTKLAVVFPQSSLVYEYIDNTVTAGIYYYRIRQVDTDGNFKYSGVKAVRVTGDNKLFVWPNPAADYIYVQSPFAKGTIEITDISGRVVQKGILNNTVTSVPVGQLAKGLYTVIIRNEGSVFTKNFIKR